MNNKRQFFDGLMLNRCAQRSQILHSHKERCARYSRLVMIVCCLMAALICSQSNIAWAIPLAPTNLVATPKDAYVDLNWTASAGATAYRMYRRTNPADAWAFIREYNDNDGTDTGLVNGTTYYYMVRAKDGSGTSGDSNIASATPIALPTAPVNVQSSVSSTQVNLTWNAVASATAYKVKRASTSGGAYSVVGNPVTNSAIDTGKTNGVTYYYKVCAVNGSGDGPDSVPVSATPRLTAPLNLTATATNAQVALAWTAVAGVTTYKICRSTVAGGPYTFLTNKNGTAHNDATAVNNTTYYYVVIATDASGESPNSNEANATPRAAPSAPAGLVATPGNTQVSLTWTSVPYATSYTIRRKVGSGSFSPVGTSPTASYLDTGLTNGANYTYKLSALTVGGESGDSATVLAVPRVTTPLNLTAAPGNTQITLSWDALAGASNFKVKRGTATGVYTNTQTIGGGNTSYNWTGLTNGTTYYFVVAAVDGAGDSPNSNEVSGVPIAVPAIPTGLAATIGNAQVNLTWNTLAGATGYVLYRKPNGGSYSVVATPATNSFLDTGLTNGAAYVYSVAASNGAGTGQNSTGVNATPKLTPPLNFAAVAGSGQVTLTWDAVLNANGYRVKRGTATGNYPTVQTLSGNGTTTYTWTGLTNGTTYYFVVDATAPNSNGNSINSLEVNATPQVGTPINLVATAGNAQVSLAWTAVGGAASYQVWRSTTSGGTYTQVGTPAGASFNNTALTNGTTYYYVVKAVSGATVSAASNEASATPNPIPAIPTGLAATVGNAQVNLTWNTVAGATGYVLYRKPNGGSYSVVATPATNSFLDTGLTNGSLYVYSVAASNGAGTSQNSTGVNATPILTPPLNFAVVAGSGQVTLTWDAVLNANGYKVKRGTATGNYPTVQTLSGNGTTTYNWTGLTNGTTYYFVVEATAPNSNGNSTNSLEVSATPTAVPSAPTGLGATGGDNQVSLAWTATAGAIKYKVKRSTVSGGPYAVIEPNALTNSYQDMTAVNGTTYYYVVSAVSAGGEGANSNQASATPLPPAPDGPGAPTFSNNTGTTVDVTAPALSANAQNFTLQVKVASQGDGTYQSIAFGLAGGSTTTAYGLDPGETYAFRYLAVGLGGSTPGTAATVAMSDRTVSWSVGGAIDCAGVYFPETGATLAPSAIGRFSSFLATDWDQRIVTLDGVPVSSAFSDPCSYTWSVRDINGDDVGTFELESMDGLGKKYGLGQSVRWAAPSTPGTYTITLIVDDQNDANKGSGDGGSRNDQDGGFDDPALVFTMAITVL